MGTIQDPLRVAGRWFDASELQVVTRLVAEGQQCSRAALMRQVCEHLDWRRPTGTLKVWECRDLFARLEAAGRLRLPPKRSCGLEVPPFGGWLGAFGTYSGVVRL